ncbi:unnamed protein product, partial [Mesorhabditis belari]|uniref:Exosome complex component RRP45 n=1 Tax=Mesorhabditis belari TaxID=2138241 RepID=A0AAF3J722_9BILA
MRDEPPTLCEREFVVQGIVENLRLDGRSRDDFRAVKLFLGSQTGTALCTLGNTKVYCTVSGEIGEPTRNRPSKGLVFVDVDMSPMANPSFQHGRLGSKGFELRRMLELVIRDSRCIDVESLCIRAGKEVWKVQVNIKVLDDDGCLLDCASVAAAAALHHYRRPMITVEPERTIIHSEREYAPVPLNIHHMPLCVMYGFIRDGEISITDPDSREELYLDGCLWLSVNKRKEICGLHQTSRLILTTAMIEACANRSFQRVSDLTDLITEICANDAATRSKNQVVEGFSLVFDELLHTNENHPNELIGPAIPKAVLNKFGPAEKDEASTSAQLDLNDATCNDDEMDDAKIQLQAEQIAASLKVQEENKEEGKAKKTPGSRKKENTEVMDLLDGLDDVGTADVVEKTHEQPPQTGDQDFSLLSAKRKKK